MNNYKNDQDVPQLSNHDTYWGSDYIARMLSDLGYKYVAINPGSSFRGLHDSIVNELGNEDPSFLVCLHEEHAVSIAHGWAKVTGEPMAVILHANVGLMHASMAIYNAWCDRVPISIFGATGPVSADLRRPWIDWIHTSRDQAALVRPYVKWDDQPNSLQSSLKSMARADQVTRSYPMGPTYVCFDVTVQEQKVDQPPVLPNVSRFKPLEVPAPNDQQLDQLNDLLSSAKRPVFLLGRLERSESAWNYRVRLAEAYSAKVITDIKTGATFPSNHPLHVNVPSFFLTPEGKKTVAESDLVVSFDWVDLAGDIGDLSKGRKIVQVTMDHQLANGWSCDHMGLAEVDLSIVSSPDKVIEQLLERADYPTSSYLPSENLNENTDEFDGLSSINPGVFATIINRTLSKQPVTFVRLPLGWNGADLNLNHPLDYLGYDGGAGIGSGPGMVVGAALALDGSGRIPIGVLGDGDTMMGISALWTGARYKAAFIIIVCNNRSYFNDEIHQEKVAQIRGRPVENKSIGQAIHDPDIDFNKLAEAQGVEGIGPVHTPAQLSKAIIDAIELYKDGRAVLIDARVSPDYAKEMAKGMTS